MEEAQDELASLRALCGRAGILSLSTNQPRASEMTVVHRFRHVRSTNPTHNRAQSLQSHHTPPSRRGQSFVK